MNETFLQKMIALGIALTFLKHACPEKFRNCIRSMDHIIEMIEELRAMPKWKKRILNYLLS
jgi:hypothetical protein